MLKMRKSPRIGENEPRVRSIRRVETAVAGTGTEVTCSPEAPEMLKRTCQEPEAMIQTVPV